MNQSSNSAEPLLEVRGLSVSYGAIAAVKSVDLLVRSGEAVCLIGSNGAGKSTTLKAITGLIKAAAGTIKYAGERIDGVGPWTLVRRGIALVPEGRGVFTRMSIVENLLMGAYTCANRAAVAQEMERVYGIFPRLRERREQLAGTLSGGEQQMLAIGRALMSRPRLLLLDEPSMGLSPLMVEKVFEVIRMIARDGVTVLLVEQNAYMALSIAQRAYVMDSGVVTIEGESAVISRDPHVRSAYLGQ